MRLPLASITFAVFTLTLIACTTESVERAPTERGDDIEAIETPDPPASPGDAEPDPTAAQAVDPVITPDEDPAPSPTPVPTAAPTPEPTPTQSVEDTFAGADWMERGRLNVLLAGTDPGFYHAGSRTDAMMVASFDLNTGHVALFGIPRSFGDIPLPDHIATVLGYRTYTGQINALYRIGEVYPHLFPDAIDPGMHILKGAIEELLGIPIDYYAMMNMQGFVQIIDAFGGVEVNVRERVQVRLLSPDEGVGFRQFDIQPGEQTLGGEEALAYARSRTGASDYERMERQRCIVSSAVDQADLTTLLRNFPDLVDAFREHVVTDVLLEQLPDLVMLRDQVQSDQIIAIGFNPPDFVEGATAAGHQRPNLTAIQETVQQVFADPSYFLEDGGTDVIDDRHC